MVHSYRLRRDFFLFDYITCSSEKLGFQKKKKKKKKKRILPETTTKLFVFGVIRNHPENNYFKISHSFGKLHKNYNKWGPCLFLFLFFFFFGCTDLKKIS